MTHASQPHTDYLLKQRIEILEGLNAAHIQRIAFLELESDCLAEIRDYIMQADLSNTAVEDVFEILVDFRLVPGTGD